MSRQEDNPTIGNAELRLLNYVGEHEPITVREVADSLGAELGYVRTTVLQMMERLRKKGLLEREKVAGLFRYRTAKPRSGVMKSVVERFVQESLGGSLSPLLLYLSEAKGLDQEDVAHLNRIISELEEKEGEK
jgi:predicted transcriptional regulator